MRKIIIGAIVIVIVPIVLFYALNAYIYNEKQASVIVDHKNAEYRIEDVSIQLKDGFSEIEVAPGSAAKITTRYFGNDYIVDLNNDGREDVVFLVTQETGGTGLFYYAVAALNTENGYVGSDGYFLGDRIAPQTIERSTNSRHTDVIVVNYADHGVNEPMTTEPSVGQSVYLKLDTTNMMWEIVEPDFEGESR